jgi:hypothetical protein
MQITPNAIFEKTWLDVAKCFELTHTLEVGQWIPNSRVTAALHQVSVFLPLGTIGKIVGLSWDFRNSADKRFWMMKIETLNGNLYDAMYPELLASGKEADVLPGSD